MNILKKIKDYFSKDNTSIERVSEAATQVREVFKDQVKIANLSTTRDSLLLCGKNNVAVYFSLNQDPSVTRNLVYRLHREVQEQFSEGIIIDRIILVARGEAVKLDIFELDFPKVRWISVDKSPVGEILSKIDYCVNKLEIKDYDPRREKEILFI